MEALREWITTILTVVIFVTFVEILIPNSHYKRYINVVVGFLIMIVILNPVIHFFSSEVSIGDEILQTTNKMESLTMQNRSEAVSYDHNQAIIDLYKDNLKRQMKKRIEENTEYAVQEINLVVEEQEGEQYGAINGVEIVLQQKDKKEGVKEGIETIKINNVVINKKNNNTVETNSIMIDSEGEYIKNDLSNFYHIPQESISIYIQKNK